MGCPFKPMRAHLRPESLPGPRFTNQNYEYSKKWGGLPPKWSYLLLKNVVTYARFSNWSNLRRATCVLTPICNARNGARDPKMGYIIPFFFEILDVLQNMTRINNAWHCGVTALHTNSDCALIRPTLLFCANIVKDVPRLSFYPQALKNQQRN